MDSAVEHGNESLSGRKFSGWKVLWVFAVTFIVSMVAGGVVGLVTRQIGLALNLGDPAQRTLSWVGITTARLVLWLPATWYVFKRRLLDISFGSGQAWWAGLLQGAGVTSAALAIVFIAARLSGWLGVDGWVWQTMAPGPFAGRLWVTLLINACVALGEEVIFRGYLLTGLKQAWGRWPGLIVMSVIFGTIHLLPYTEQGLGSITLVLAILLATALGLMMGLAALRTSALWMPIGMHFAWNLVETDLLNLGGDGASESLIGALTRLQGLLSTGSAGLGEVILPLLGFGLLCIGLWLTLRRGASPAGDPIQN